MCWGWRDGLAVRTATTPALREAEKGKARACWLPAHLRKRRLQAEREILPPMYRQRVTEGDT